MEKVRPSSPPLRARTIAVLAFVLLMLAPTSGLRADTHSALDRAKARLSQLESRISAERSQLARDHAQVRAVQGRLNKLAVGITKAQDRYNQLESAVMAIRGQLAATRARYQSVRDRLDQRASRLPKASVANVYDVQKVLRPDFLERLGMLPRVDISAIDAGLRLVLEL